MLISNLKCCTITKIESDIAELVYTYGAELTGDDIDHIHALLEKKLDHPYMILVDKRTKYSYADDAQGKLGEGPSLKAVAILSHDAIAAAMQRYLQKLHPDKPVNLEVFDSRDAALSWLSLQR